MGLIARKLIEGYVLLLIVYGFLFFSPCFMSICNPVGYDRLERLYIQNSGPACRPSVVHFCVVSPRLIHDLWGFSPPDSDLIWLNPQAVPPQPGHFFAAILAPAPSPPLFHPLRLIPKIPIRGLSLFHWRATLLAPFSQSSLAS